jgi:hypothetical protein
MANYVTKSARVEAVQWDGQPTSLQSLSQSLGDLVALGPHATLVVVTPEGLKYAAPGDWVVKDDSGAAFPVEDSVFRNRFEPVKNPAERSLRVVPRPWLQFTVAHWWTEDNDIALWT